MTSCNFHISAILRVLIYIEQHLDEPILLENLSQVAHISPFHFHRLFRAYTDETCKEYIQRLRLQRAEEKLRYTNEPITTIAHDVGYETSSSFSKIFHQVMGQSPREYRKRLSPVVQKLLARQLSTPKWTPVYQKRDEETVLFVRRIGDYTETPWKAFDALLQFLENRSIKQDQIVGFYSIALDDPNIVDRSKCRFDACVKIVPKVAPYGEVGERKLPGGLFACFEYTGPSSGIESAFTEIYRSWHPSPNYTLADKESFCEYIDFDRITKIYIPINKS